MKIRILCLIALFLVLVCYVELAEDGIPIGSRLELMLDNYLIQTKSGEVELRLHPPVARNVALVTDAPWEGNACHYRSVFRDGDVYRMYYSGLHWEEGGAAEKAMPQHPGFLLYAESRDGIHWKKPELGLVTFSGSSRNNILLSPEALQEAKIDPAHFSVFRDDNPACPPDARYKAFIVGQNPRGLFPFKSADGIRFVPMQKTPVITKGAFDSQNLAFWDPLRAEYREYHRDFFEDKQRGIRTSTSKDFLHWTEPIWLEFPGAAHEQLYTNQVQPYYRAPHIFLGFPMRYVDRGVTPVTYDLPNPELRKLLVALNPRYGTTVTDGLFMSSRNGTTFKRWGEAFLRPGLEGEGRGRWFYGDNSPAWGLLETQSEMSPKLKEISLFATEGYRTATSLNVRRYSLRLDGFVSMQASLRGGEFVTKPIVFKGSTLVLNFSTSAAGSIRIEMQEPSGQPIAGYGLAESPELFGDSLERSARWSAGSGVSRLAGRTVRLRFVMKDADLYSFRFR